MPVRTVLWILWAFFGILGRNSRERMIRVRQDGCDQNANILAMGPGWLRKQKITQERTGKINWVKETELTRRSKCTLARQEHGRNRRESGGCWVDMFWATRSKRQPVEFLRASDVQICWRIEGPEPVGSVTVWEHVGSWLFENRAAEIRAAGDDRKHGEENWRLGMVRVHQLWHERALCLSCEVLKRKALLS